MTHHLNSSRSLSESRWEEFKDRHRHSRSRSSSSESLALSDSDSQRSDETSQPLFQRFQPRISNVLFSPTKVYGTDIINTRSPRPISRSRINLFSEKSAKRTRETRKRIITTNALSRASKTKVGPSNEQFVTRFSRRFQRISTRVHSNLPNFVRSLLNFQNSFLAELTPLERDEFNIFYFQLSNMGAMELVNQKSNRMQRHGKERAIYLFKNTVRTPNFKFFEKFGDFNFKEFFCLTSFQSLTLWQTFEKIAAPLRKYVWFLINQFAPARFFLQPTLQDAFVDVFSLTPASSQQYTATLKRFAKFINEARDHPTSNIDSQIAFALTSLKRCDNTSYHFIQGWLLKQLARGLAFTTLRTYCLHLSWFQQPNEKRYAKSQEFKRFLIQSVARFFTDTQDHGVDAMDQETLTAFWKIFETSNFDDALYDKHGFAWMLQLALRTSEAINNMWVNIDFNDNNVGVIQKIRQAKNQQLYGKTYILALQATKDKFCPVKCLRFLATHGSSEFVFYNRRKNRAWTNHSLNKRFKFYVAQLPSRLRQRKKFTVYSMRASFACSMAQANVDVSLIQQFMRHKSPSSTMTYIQKAFPHLQFANLLSNTSTTPTKESFSSSFLSNLTSVQQI